MKTVLIGVGQAGGKVATALTRYDEEMGFRAVRDAIAVNTANADLQGLPLDTVLVGQDRVNGQGVGSDTELGAELMQADADEVMTELGGCIDSTTEAVFIVAGLGGGTGGGGAPVLATRLREVYDVPVYAIGILPGRDEGALYQVNAGRSLKTLSREADSVILIDNDAWHSTGNSVEEGMAAINRNIAQRIGLLLAAGQPIEERSSLGLGGKDVERSAAQSVVDSSEVINTLQSGGFAAVGYAASAASDDPDENVNVVTSTTRQAVLTGTSLPNAVEADAALVVVAGRPDAISRKGVDSARSWVEDQTQSMAVRGGDFPMDVDRVISLVLVSGIERSGRVQEFLDRAAEAERETTAQEREKEAADEFESEELNDLF